MIAFLFSPIGRALAVVALVMGLGFWLYSKGAADERAKCEEDALRSQIEALELQLDIAEAAAAQAARLTAEEAARADKSDQRLKDYTATLNESPDCGYTDDEWRGLLELND
jgi:hypothetical protein